MAFYIFGRLWRQGAPIALRRTFPLIRASAMFVHLGLSEFLSGRIFRADKRFHLA
jgi:hypothetical protein